MSASKRILDVGQCNIDGPRIGRFLREMNCTVDRAHSKDQALALTAASRYDLVLVNRVLNNDRSPGIDVIAALYAAHPSLRMMLVSDYPDAQEEAMQRGAIQGFGKASLESPETEKLICAALSDA
jgi:DNA-binding NarL/FixJ family response regulator